MDAGGGERRRRVLVVEDEMLVAMLIEDMLDELGYEVVGPALRVQEALALARSELFDLAILDVNLDGVPSFAVADILRERNIPFVFATGYGPEGVATDHRGAGVVKKPFQLQDLSRALEAFES